MSRVSDDWACPQQIVVKDEGTMMITSGDNWRCDNMACVHRIDICNDVYDCKDKSDERRCRKISLSLFTVTNTPNMSILLSLPIFALY